MDIWSNPPTIYRVNSDGTNLRALSSQGSKNCYPAWTGNGRILYSSETQKGDRCGGAASNLFSMAANGSDVFPISCMRPESIIRYLTMTE